MVKIRNVALSYPDRIFSLENFQILVPVEIWKFFKFFRYPINHTDNMKPMAGPSREEEDGYAVYLFSTSYPAIIFITLTVRPQEVGELDEFPVALFKADRA